MPPNTYQAPRCQQARHPHDACLLFAAFVASASPSPSSPTFVSICGFQALESLHQTPIGDLDRSPVAAPCPRNSSVPSRVQSSSSRLFGQLAPGSGKGQSSKEKRPSALRECAEGRRVSNQAQRMPGTVHRPLVSGPHGSGSALRSLRNRLQLDGGLTHLRSCQLSAKKRSLSKTRSFVSMK